MKTYNQFLNENHATGEFNRVLPIGYKFSIDFTNATREQFLEFEKEIRKYFIFKNGILTYSVQNQKPWAWQFEISVGSNGVDLEYWPITMSKNSNLLNTDSGIKFMSTLIPIDEFLTVGFDGIKNYIKMKKDANKYNL